MLHIQNVNTYDHVHLITKSLAQWLASPFQKEIDPDNAKTKLTSQALAILHLGTDLDNTDVPWNIIIW